MSLQKLFKENGLGIFVVVLLVAYAVYYFSSHLASKGKKEGMQAGLNTAYYNYTPSTPGTVLAANPMGENEYYSQTDEPAPQHAAVASNNIQNPDDLLPKNDSNSEWAKLNPSGKGELSNINLLKAGYHIGIDTVGQTLRNANLQIRSEPANPVVYAGPWNQSTIEPDPFRAPFEIGSGTL
ncbi:MAG: hypothetical protein EBU01_09965 [Crocinitomicaceae bacterium]|nr:hypothetical protein [Crocinitomicaceae bacterium]